MLFPFQGNFVYGVITIILLSPTYLYLKSLHNPEKSRTFAPDFKTRSTQASWVSKLG